MNKAAEHAHRPPVMVETVNGPVAPEELGLTDAHTHVWIEPLDGVSPGSPQLFDREAIAVELNDYRLSGGGALVDCQPGGCGRDGRVLRILSSASGVHIVACTGFHLKKYYPPDFWLFRHAANADDVAKWFVQEICDGLIESNDQPQPVRAGFIKASCEATLAATSLGLLDAAAMAAIQTGVAIQVHTEKGADAEKIAARFQRLGLSLNKLILCHLDKRPDATLHQELAEAGVILEYDTFYREKYDPDNTVWPLLEKMVGLGFGAKIAIGTDMAESAMWSLLGGGPGQTAYTGQILARLRRIGIDENNIQQLMGKNIAFVLAAKTDKK